MRVQTTLFAVLVAAALIAPAGVMAAGQKAAKHAAAEREPTQTSQAPDQPPAAPAGGGSVISELAQALAQHDPRQPVTQVSALLEAVLRLPVATLLGAALAFRPRRRGTPPRTPAVIQTQIVLAVVGCLVMLIVGSSLARAFGIVGAAGLIRYRAKIGDPKDAAVMLTTLGVGLAAGVGLHLLAGFATVFVLVVLWLIESLDEGIRVFDLKVSGQDVARLRPAIERLLGRERLDFDLRASGEQEVAYEVRMPIRRRTEELSNAILRLDPSLEPAVVWEEKNVKS